MFKFVRPTGNVKPVGAQSEVFKSRSQNLRQGDYAEIVNQEGATLNIARVEEVTTDGEGNEVLRIVMIA
jgi:hypothetical protein